ncbi:polysaccharide export protein, partial [Escherichia coli]|nr:polysaccharide export protein [Escherichia coli]
SAQISHPVSIAATPEVLRSIDRYERAYLLVPGDTIEVVVDQMAEVSRTVTIRADGFVALPKVGEVRLAGMTVPQATRLVRDRLNQRIYNPEVTLILTNPRDDKVFVTGEVGRPAAVSLRDARTAAEALIQAGDTVRSASLRNVALIRLDPSGHLVANLIPTAAGGRAGLLLALQNVVLQPGDIIVVQESGRSQFTRFVQDFISTPLNGFNQLLTPYIQFRL